MPADMGTLTDDDVAFELGVVVDERVTIATDTARAWVETACTAYGTPPDEVWRHPARHRGGVLEGCFQYHRRGSPEGMPGFYDETGGDVWTLHMEAERLIRPDVVIA